MDQKEKLYNLYVKKNLITDDKVSLKMWNQMSIRQQENIFKLGLEKGLFTDAIKVEQFTSLWAGDVKKKTIPNFLQMGWRLLWSRILLQLQKALLRIQ